MTVQTSNLHDPRRKARIVATADVDASHPDGGPRQLPDMPVLHDDVCHPLRYTKGLIECIDAIDSAVTGKPPEEAVCVANIIKYLWRYEEKEPVRSLRSAKWYLERLIEKVRCRTETAYAVATETAYAVAAETRQ